MKTCIACRPENADVPTIAADTTLISSYFTLLTLPFTSFVPCGHSAVRKESYHQQPVEEICKTDETILLDCTLDRSYARFQQYIRQ